MKLSLSVLLGITAIVAVESQWHYHGEHGLEDWPKEFAQCGGQKQSPINVDHFFTVPAQFEPFYFEHYHEVPTEEILTNNGHTLEVKIKAKDQPQLAGGNLGGSYTFAQYHTHWGADDLRGSEHTINYVRYPMEQHLVHFKTEYGNLSAALEKPDGVAVLGIFFEISELDNPAMAPIIAKIQQNKNVVEQKLTTDLYPLTSVLPRDLSRFYRYQGSLTTPPCKEVVTWTLFAEHIPVSEKQMNSIRDLIDDEQAKLVDNFRPAQPLNGRKVYRSFQK